MIQDKIFFDEKDPTGLSYNTPFTFYGSYQGRLYSKTPTGSIKYYTQNSDLSVYATTGSNQFSGSQTVTGSLTVTGTITGTVAGTTATASYVEYTNVANKPALVSGSSQVTYSGLTGIPSGIVSGSAQIADFGIFATTGSNGFNGSQSITGSLTVTGQVIAQTLNVQQVTSSIVYSSGSNVFGNTLGNTQQFTGSVSVTGSLAVAGAGTFTGALNGTSASFTGVVSTLSSTTNGFLAQTNANSVHPYFRWVANNRSYWAAAIDSGTDATFKIGGGNTIGSSPFFTIDSGTNASTFTTTLAVTGAATFSSSVTAGGLVTVNAAGNAVNIIGLVGNPSYYAVDQAVNNSGKRWRFGHTGGVLSFSSWDVYNETDNILALTIASTGAATFSNTASGLALKLSTSYSSGRALNFGFSDGSVLPNAAFYIGNQTAVGVFIGDETTTNGLYVKGNGNVGIGTTSPKNLLDIAGKGGISLNSGDLAYSNNLYFLSGDWKRQSTLAGSSVYQTAGIVIFYTAAAGGSVDGAVTPTETARITTGGDFTIIGSNATKASGTAWINPSDSRLKENIQTYSKGLKELLLINPKIWNYNKASGVIDTLSKHVSPIAQELEEVMPEMVIPYKGKLNGKDADLLSVDGSDYTMLLINAVKELKAEIDELKSKN